MWRLWTILLMYSSVAAAKINLKQICAGLYHGEVLQNPIDCSSYIVCSSEARIGRCNVGLHFDVRRKVCNWPEYAKCKLPAMNPNAGSHSIPLYDVNLKSTRATGEETQTKSGIRQTIEDKPINNFMAIDISTGEVVDPMRDYEPNEIGCRHFGAYFMPHPHNCHMYYVCAYGYLHEHHCGRGTFWNYKREECELSQLAECYHKTADEDMEDNGTNVIVTNTTSSLNNSYTVCFTITTKPEDDDPSATATTTSPQVTGSTSSWNPSDPTWHPTGSYHTATTESPTTPTVTKPTTMTTTTTQTVSSTTSADAVIECPDMRQSYLPYTRDCSKYYICIVGMPVLTSCPEGLYWDQKAEFCDLAKNVECKVNA